MAEYNPNNPSIAGNEWAPIVPAPYLMDTGVERGYSFTLASSATPFQGQYFLQAEPPARIFTQCPLLAIYPKGSEATVGEIKTIVVPVDGGTITGDGHLQGPFATVAQALQSSSDSAGVVFTPGVGTSGTLTCSFDTAATATTAELSGKRILNVSFVYTSGGDWTGITRAKFSTAVRNSAGADLYYGPGPLNGEQSLLGSTVASVSRISLGEIDINAMSLSLNTDQVYPWRSASLAKWDASSGTPLRFRCAWTDLIARSLTTLGDDYTLNYLALEITYCEETRVLYGATNMGPSSISLSVIQRIYAVPGENNVILRTASTLATGSSLAAGDYTITSCMGDLGDLSVTVLLDIPEFASTVVAPTAQACRQLYPMPHSILDGVVVDRALTINERFDVARSDTLNYVAFNTAFGGASHASTHAYGQQHPAAVYTGHSVKQNFNFTTVSATPYPWLRFYARRFGTCSASLTAALTSNGAESVTLTCAAFDALPEIADGWKEITLPMAVSATLATGADSLVWSSSAPAASPWEILADKGQSPNSASSFQTSTNALEDPTGTSYTTDDATFYFMQQPPTVTGVSSSVGVTALTGIGLECGSPAECVPTGMPYAQVSWTSISTSSPTSSGTFGAYEVERQDDADATWQLIGRFRNIATVTMRDVEPRFGMASRYRVTVRNIYNVLGTPSATTSAVLGAVDPSVWAFTSNHLNTSIFMAPQVGSDAPNFEPGFPEGDSVSLQDMYGRDFVTAFHGTERGGDRFSLVLLANNGAVSLPQLDHLFTTFRDLAWSSIPYVCVRTGEGDRWYANVQVPSGSIRSRKTSRKTQLVSVRVAETLAVPTPFEG